MIIEKYSSNEIIFSSNIIEGIKVVCFFFFHEKISHTQKSPKIQNANKQLSLKCFLYPQKVQKA